MEEKTMIARAKAKKIAIMLSCIFQLVCVVLFIMGKFTFYEFITSVTLLDILMYLEKRS